MHIYYINSLVVFLPVLDWADIRKQEEGAGVDRVDGSVHDGGDQGLEEDHWGMGDEEGLDEDVTSRAPGGLPGDNVDVYEQDLQIEIVELPITQREEHKITR